MTNDQFTEWLESRIAKHESDIEICPGELSESRIRSYMAEAVRILEQYKELAPIWIPVTPETMLPPTGVLGCGNKVSNKVLAVCDGTETIVRQEYVRPDFKQVFWVSVYDDEIVHPTYYQIITPLPAPPIK